MRAASETGDDGAPQPRADARRSERRILDAARDLLAADPYASLQRVADVSGLHRATVYRHFASREDLITRLYDAWLEDVGAVISGLDPEAPDVLAELRRVTKAIYEANVVWKAFAWAPAFPSSYAEPRDGMIDVLERAFTRARDEGVLRGDMTVLELHTAWGAPIQYLSSRIVDGSWTTDEAVDFTLRLVTAPGAQRPTAR
jgi:AcrR family transcriptional regulator